MFHLDVFLHNREAILCPSPSPCPYNCKYSYQCVALNIIRVYQIKLLLLFGDFILEEFMLYQNVEISFLLNSQTLLVTQPDELIHHCFWKSYSPIAPAWMQVSLFCISPASVIGFFNFFVLGFFFSPSFSHFSFVFLSHLFPSANAQHYRVCGVQPIQPSGLQQLQTGREPKQQQSGNGMNINIEKTRWLNMWGKPKQRN